VLVRFRYALGTWWEDGGLHHRSVVVYLNGEEVATLDLAPTGDWAVWEFSPAQLVKLEAGSNTISVAQADDVDNHPNVDFMELYSADSDVVFDRNYAYRMDAGAVNRVDQEDSTIDYCDYTPPPGSCAARPSPAGPGGGHRRLQMFGAGEEAGTLCDLHSIAARADQVESTLLI
jgi:hypothetical protein